MTTVIFNILWFVAGFWMGLIIKTLVHRTRENAITKIKHENESLSEYLDYQHQLLDDIKNVHAEMEGVYKEIVKKDPSFEIE